MSGDTAAADGPNVNVQRVITDLSSKLSSGAKIVTEHGDEWNTLMERWSDIMKQTPAAIICVATEADVQEAVKLCLAHGVKFVPKAGGHSLWSTIGAEGVIIDLSAFKAIVVDKEASTVTVSGGTQNKEVVVALHEAGLCCPFGNGSTVGSIPQAIGGGLTYLAGTHGFTSDAILSARIVTAKGDLITVSAMQNPSLFYALKGAGQHFGLVTSLTLRAFPLSTLGSPDGTLWKTAAIFPASRIAEIVQALTPIVGDTVDPRAAGTMLIGKDPSGSGNTIVICGLTYAGSDEDAIAHYGAIKALGPFMWGERRISYLNINDDFESYCGTGGYNRNLTAGIPRVQSNTEVWERQVQMFDAMVAKCGAASARSFIGFQWNGKAEEGKFAESAFGHRGVKTWIESVSLYVDKEFAPVVEEWEQAAIRVGTEGFEEKEVESYQNASRGTTIESRFPGEERLERLKALKREWDPEGVFTDVFL